MAACLTVEQCEIVRRVVGDHRRAPAEEVAECRHDLRGGLGRRPPLGACALRGDAVHGGRTGGDLDSRIDEPVTAFTQSPVAVEKADVGRDDPRGLHVDAGGLEVEYAQFVVPRAHGLSVEATPVTVAEGQRRGSMCNQ